MKMSFCLWFLLKWLRLNWYICDSDCARHKYLMENSVVKAPMFSRSYASKDNVKKHDPEVNFMIISGTMKIQVFHLFHIAFSCFTVYRAHLLFKWMPINNSVWSLMNNNLCILNIAYINHPILHKSTLKNCSCHLKLWKSKNSWLSLSPWPGFSGTQF